MPPGLAHGRRAWSSRLIVLALVTLALAACAPATPTGPAAPRGADRDDTPQQIVAPHFVDSYPTHGQSFVLAPETIVVNFNFTLNETSTLAVTRDGQAVPVPAPTFNQRKLAMRAPLGRASGGGRYVVTYRACWPDTSCHDGQFAFTVDSGARAEYVDMTGKSDVTVPMEQVAFRPARILISRGTKVTWVNNDPVAHFVNSDPHPSHNALTELNSLDIQKGDTYSFTFTQTGEWAYHCSAHVPDGMLGRIIVVE